jgi:hypothetical protein
MEVAANSVDSFSRFSWNSSFDTVLKEIAGEVAGEKISLPFPKEPISFEKVHETGLESSSRSLCNIVHVKREMQKRDGKNSFEIMYFFSPTCFIYLNEFHQHRFLGDDIESVVGDTKKALVYYQNHFECVLEIYKQRYCEDATLTVEVKEKNDVFKKYEYSVIVKGDC